MISVEDYLHYTDEALDGMVEIVTGLGDELANRAPDLPGANSPYVILTHCLGVLEFWAGHVVLGRADRRNRDAEFRAAGPVAELADRAEAARRQLHEDARAADPSAPPAIRLDADDATLPLGRTQGGALVHIYEELAQHRGHLELTRDVLRAAR